MTQKEISVFSMFWNNKKMRNICLMKKWCEMGWKIQILARIPVWRIIGFCFPLHCIDIEHFCFTVLVIPTSDKRRFPIWCQWWHKSMLILGWNLLLYSKCTICWNFHWMTFFICIEFKAKQDPKFWKRITCTIHKIESQIINFGQFATN